MKRPAGQQEWDGRDFAAHFAELAIPRLTERVKAEAFLLATDPETHLWSEAAAEVMRLACHLGATSLPGPLLHDLEDWIDRELLTETLEAEQRVEGIDADLTAEELADPVGYWTRMVQQSAPRNRWAMQAVGMALNPAYRLHVRRERKG